MVNMFYYFNIKNMTIDEKFDDEFNIAFYGNRNFIKFTPKEIKQFYNQQIKEMIDKIIGEAETNYPSAIGQLTIKEIAKEYGIK